MPFNEGPYKGLSLAQIKAKEKEEVSRMRAARERGTRKRAVPLTSKNFPYPVVRDLVGKPATQSLLQKSLHMQGEFGCSLNQCRQQLIADIHSWARQRTAGHAASMAQFRLVFRDAGIRVKGLSGEFPMIVAERAAEQVRRASVDQIAWYMRARKRAKSRGKNR